MTRRNPAEAADDSRKSFNLALAALRELHIRRHAFQRSECRNDAERRQWDEGPVDVRQLAVLGK